MPRKVRLRTTPAPRTNPCRIVSSSRGKVWSSVRRCDFSAAPPGGAVHTRYWGAGATTLIGAGWLRTFSAWPESGESSA